MSSSLPPSNKQEARPVDVPEMLPTPHPEECAHSDKLVMLIRNEIASCGGAIGFARFMELALYAPALGYYSAGKQKFGAAGDFITAPELSSLFARCVARQCHQVLAQPEHADILEAGAGSGALAADLLLELETLGRVPNNYFILELSAELRERQARTLKQKAPHLIPRVHWLDALPDQGFRGVILGNELLDAMPVERFCICDDGVRQLHVGWEDRRLVWKKKPANENICRRIQPLGLPTGYTSEINFHAEAWVSSMARVLEQGVVLLIDYGFPRAEFYHSQRDQGTLMCHYRHRVHDNPLVLVGLQDITAHVDFTAVARAASKAGLSVLGYTSQAAFLLASGLDEIVAGSDPEKTRQHLELTQQIKKLTLPSEMGELYKVIALGRGVDSPLQGFQIQDRRGRL